MVKEKSVSDGVQLLVAPASREIATQAISNGSIEAFSCAGANILPSSCGPCLGKGMGIPADGWNVISTANRNNVPSICWNTHSFS